MRFLFRHASTDPLGHLPMAQLRMVRSLAGGPRVATDLSVELGMTASAISQTIQRLEKMGMIERHTDESDRRVRRIALSEEGARLLHERQGLRVERARKVLAEMPEEHRRRLIDSLDELIATVLPMSTDPIHVALNSISMVAEIESRMPPIAPFSTQDVQPR